MISKSCNRLVHASVIAFKDFIITLSCICCLSLNILCIVMKNCFKCAECVHHGHFCVELSLKTLNCFCDKQKSKLNVALEEHKHLIAKIFHLQKTLCQSQDFQNKKSLCPAQELVNDNNEMKNKDSSDMSKMINLLLSLFWDFILLFSSQNVAVFSHSSWGFSDVFRCFLRYHISFTWWGSEVPH